MRWELEHIEESASQRRTWYMLTSKSVCEMVGLLCNREHRSPCLHAPICGCRRFGPTRTRNNTQILLLSVGKDRRDEGCCQWEWEWEMSASATKRKSKSVPHHRFVPILDRFVSTLLIIGKKQKREISSPRNDVCLFSPWSKTGSSRGPSPSRRCSPGVPPWWWYERRILGAEENVVKIWTLIKKGRKNTRVKLLHIKGSPRTHRHRKTTHQRGLSRRSKA